MADLLTDEELAEAKCLCQGCRDGWALGRHGCHYEPVPLGCEDEDFDGMMDHCSAWRIRRIEFHGRGGSSDAEQG